MLLDQAPCFKQFCLHRLHLGRNVQRPHATSDDDHAHNVYLAFEAAWIRHLESKTRTPALRAAEKPQKRARLEAGLMTGGCVLNT